MRNRLRRRIGVFLGLVVVIALTASLAFSLYSSRRLARATERFEVELGTLDLGRFMLSAVAESDNAAIWLAAGAGAVVLSEEEHEFLRRVGRSSAMWSEEEAARVQRLVDVNRPAFELLRGSLDCRGSDFGIDYSQGADAQLPELIELLRAGRLLWLDGRLALAAGDRPRLGTDLEVLDRLTESLAGESLVITSLVALGLDRYMLDLVHRLVTAGTEDATLLDAAERSLAGRDRRELLRRALAAEGAMMASASPEMLLAGNEGGTASRVELLLSRPAHRLLLAGALEEYARFATLADSYYAEVLLASPPTESGLLPSPHLAILYPNLIDWLGKLKIEETATRLAGEALRIWRLRLAGGAWPTVLEPLGPDPYSGRPMTVEPRPDGTLVLEARGALELWRERNPHDPFPGEPPFVWVLPAVPDAVSR